ncbi:hypothetical protein DSO57_1020936 [Entomophthora muscae]|uniref:Uncharacterized protein n=1 Tax=Entomophthora muscae TaxID=34485 RepID=A0ACC2U237_9FUNG|nr:hypothetical protein DSO57_1020936 [Entomophthora muscae]
MAESTHSPGSVHIDDDVVSVNYGSDQEGFQNEDVYSLSGSIEVDQEGLNSDQGAAGSEITGDGNFQPSA